MVTVVGDVMVSISKPTKNSDPARRSAFGLIRCSIDGEVVGSRPLASPAASSFSSSSSLHGLINSRGRLQRGCCNLLAVTWSWLVGKAKVEVEAAKGLSLLARLSWWFEVVRIPFFEFPKRLLLLFT